MTQSGKDVGNKAFPSAPTMFIYGASMSTLIQFLDTYRSANGP